MRFLMFLSLTIPLSLYSQQPAASTLAPIQNTETPRYVLVTASVPAVDNGKIPLPLTSALFLLDNQSGRVWKYQPDSLIWSGNEPLGVAPVEMFAPVFIAQTDQELSQRTTQGFNAAVELQKKLPKTPK